MTFLWQGQIFVTIQIFEISLSQHVLKTYGWNLQCMIQIVNIFSFNQNDGAEGGGVYLVASGLV